MGGEVDTLRDDANNPALAGMIAHAHAGGIVELDWHPNDPVDDSYPGTPLNADQLSQMTQPGTVLYNTWHASLDGAATVLQKFASSRRAGALPATRRDERHRLLLVGRRRRQRRQSRRPGTGLR